MMGRLVLLLILAGVVWCAWYLLASPISIDPAPWDPPTGPRMTGAYQSNARLASIERVGSDLGVGPEDVAVDADGRIYAGMEDGRIVRFGADGANPEAFAETGGRPLGLDFDAAGNLIVADAFMGLLSVSPDGDVSVLSTEQGGVPFRLTDDVDVARDGTIYFTDASHRFSLDEYIADLMEHRPNGRLLAFDPASGETRLVLDGLYFANGVAVSDDQRFVVVVETGKYRVRRVWLSGDQAGTNEVFHENLPGFPDGISADGRGRFWLTLVSPRDPYLDDQLLPSPFMRRIVWRLPESFLPQPMNRGFVILLDAAGGVDDVLQDPAGRYAQITSVERVGDHLYFGSLVETSVGRIAVP